MGNFELKKVVENQINEILNSGEDKIIHGFLLCNIDHFASINDRYGREKADAILDEIDFFIRNFFRGSDIKGRVRGDEYEILVRKPNSLSDIEVIAEKFLAAISEKQFAGVNISLTVGISVFPFHGTAYRQLKEKAYQALVRAKHTKGNSYRIFDAALTKTMYSDFVLNKTEGESDFRRLNEDEWDKYFVNVSLQLLHDDSNVFMAMNSILEIMCLYYGFNRAFVVTSDAVNPDSANTSEFYLPGAKQIDPDLSVPLRKDLVARLLEERGPYGIVNKNESIFDGEIKNYMDDFGCSEIMYFINNISDKMTGAIVFESADENNAPVYVKNMEKLAEQVLIVWSYIYLSFEMNGSKEILSKVKMFEDMDADVYIINAKSLYVEYMNEHAMSHSKGLLEKKCYEMIHGTDTPCENCPLNKCKNGEKGVSSRIECFNPSSCSWAIHLYSGLSGKDDESRLLLVSVDMDIMNTVM